MVLLEDVQAKSLALNHLVHIGIDHPERSSLNLRLSWVLLQSRYLVEMVDLLIDGPQLLHEVPV